MRKSQRVCATKLLIGLFLVAPLAAQTKLEELARPKDFSRDRQVGPGPNRGAAIVLSENFNAGIPGTWSVVNNAPGGPVWTNLAGCGESGNFTNGSGDVACVSSDIFGLVEFDTELRTPSLNLSGYTSPATLSFTANYQNFANLDFFEVDVSTNGGTTWTNLLSWNEDHGGFRATPGEDVTLNIGPYMGNPNVVFRFHYYDPNSGDWDWYIQVDNVVVDATPTGACTLTLTCPANQTATAPPGGLSTTVTYPNPTAGGTCTNPTIACVPASGSGFPVGTTAVTCTAQSGQVSAQCSFNVTVAPGAPVQAIPTASVWGLAGLGVLLAGAALWVLRRRG